MLLLPQNLDVSSQLQADIRNHAVCLLRGASFHHARGKKGLVKRWWLALTKFFFCTFTPYALNLWYLSVTVRLPFCGK